MDTQHQSTSVLPHSGSQQVTREPPIIGERSSEKRQLSNGSYQIEPREVSARMDTPIVRAILDMGFSPDSVRAVIETRLSTRGDDFLNAEKLLKALYILEGAVATAPLGHLAFGVGNIPVYGPYAMELHSQGLSLILGDFAGFGIQMRGDNGEYSDAVLAVVRLMPSTASDDGLVNEEIGLISGMAIAQVVDN